MESHFYFLFDIYLTIPHILEKSHPIPENSRELAGNLDPAYIKLEEQRKVVMSYLALYRKYRPTVFEDVAGQETTVKILKNQIISRRVGHAYLFSGIRGTGKTTLAKIFARAVNCTNPVDGSPCGECAVCKSLSAPSNMDIVEIDAASNRGVDEIRDLREKIKYPPTIGKYKVYIIDEVHMLTKEAFNALLKTLEEPPEHAMFLLATTEPVKLPPTIRSRCQHFEIRPIADRVIEARMREICAVEGLKFDDESFEILSRRARHSMRDGLSLLDQASDLERPGEVITGAEVRDLLGVAREDGLYTLARAHQRQDIGEMLDTIRNMRSSGINESLLTEDLLSYYRDLLFLRAGGPGEARDQELARTFEEEELYRAVDVLSEAHRKMRLGTLQDVLLDVALLSLVSGREEAGVSASVAPQKSRAIHPRAESGKPVSDESVREEEAPAQEEPVFEKARTVREEPNRTGEPDAGKRAEGAEGREKAHPRVSLDQVKEQVKKRLRGMAKGVLEKGKFQHIGGQFYFVLFDEQEGAAGPDSVLYRNYKKDLDRAFSDVIGRRVDLEFITLKDFKAKFGKKAKPSSEEKAAPGETGKKEEKEDVLQVREPEHETRVSEAAKKENDYMEKDPGEGPEQSLEARIRAAIPGEYIYEHVDE